MKNIGRFILWTVIGGVAIFGATRLYAAEHPGKEHPGAAKEHADKEHTETTKEHAGQTKEHSEQTKEHADTKEHAGTTAEPSHEDIRAAMRAHALEVTRENNGYFPIFDEKIGKERRLSFEQVHQRVGKLSTRDGYFSCSDFVDQETGEALDVDFWVVVEDGELSVTDAEIHKVDGKARFTYDENDQKIILE